MLEVFYEKSTKIVTAWRGESRQGKRPVRDGEAIVMLDIPIPDKPLDAWLFDETKLVPNPSWVEPQPPRGLIAEIDELKARLDKITV
ncbi:hypothetical protein LCGC14_1267290 [marine sediment metagenome]|uniref:Uncharacterized protein n=1 Tax=marine sediment metagenome TaxID=412755 RepID=A0A0F9P299_9ZZZZ